MPGTILLVDDEPELLTVFKTALEKDRHVVLAEQCPLRALETARRHKGSLELLLSDVVMPGMDGFELSRRVREMVPGIKVIFASGFPFDLDAPDGGSLFLSKPFSLSTLRSAVDAALAGG